MYQLILLIHVFAAVFIVALVLVQQGKGATMGAAFGSGASQTVFGSRGSGSFLFRITISLAVIFFITSLGLNYMATQVYKEKARDVYLPQRTTSGAKQHSEEVLKTQQAPSVNENVKQALPSEMPKQALPSEIPVRK